MDYSLETLREIEVICQLCLKNKIKVRPLNDPNILEKIRICFQIVMIIEKEFPAVVCKICVQELDIALNFQKKCVTYNEKLSYFSKQLREKKEKVVAEHDLKDKEKPYENETSNVRNTFQCSICKKTLKTKISLKKHNQSMHLKRKHFGTVTGSGLNRRHHCTKCSYSTPHSQTLVNHMRIHNGEKPYHCECGKSFTQSSSLTAHYKTHSSTTFFTCTICGKQFKHAFTLKKHQYVHESGKFQCDICKKNLKSQQALKDHIHRHYNIRNYSCEDCGNTFVSASELSNHRRTHSVMKKVECHICGYKTHTKRSLIIHLKRHAGDKSVKCDQCLLSFYTTSDLLRHQRVHTREKPFTCPTCGQRFTHSSSVNKHMISVHGIKYKWGDFKWKDQNKSV